VISVTPKVVITRISGTTVVKIIGRGFAGHQEGSGTSVTGKVVTGKGKNRITKYVEAEIVSWSDTSIEADFGSSRPNEVTVNSVFGNAKAVVQQKTGRRRSK
jgi:hypothetical protein